MKNNISEPHNSCPYQDGNKFAPEHKWRSHSLPCLWCLLLKFADSVQDMAYAREQNEG